MYRNKTSCSHWPSDQGTDEDRFASLSLNPLCALHSISFSTGGVPNSSDASARLFGGAPPIHPKELLLLNVLHSSTA